MKIPALMMILHYYIPGAGMGCYRPFAGRRAGTEKERGRRLRGSGDDE